MKRLAGYAIVILGTLAVMAALWQFRSIVILFVISLALSAALRPGFEWLAAKGLPLPLARLLLFLGVFGGIGLLLYLISGRVLAELQLLSNYLVIVYENFLKRLASGTDFQQNIAGILPSVGSLPTAIGDSGGGSIIQLATGVTQNLVALVTGLVIILVLSLYWSADRNHFERLWLSVLPAPQRIEARSIWRATETTMGAYLRSELIQMLLAGLLLGCGYLLMGLSYPLLAAMLSALAWLIPLAGFVIITGLSFLFGLASSGPTMGIVMVVYTVLVLAFLEFVVEPRLFKRKQFSSLLIIFTMIILVEAYGLAGFVIAPPLAVALQVLGSHVAQIIQRPKAMTLQLQELEDRLSALRESFSLQESAEPRKEIESLLERLETLVDQVREEAVPFD